jgi:hypothetical protein
LATQTTDAAGRRAAVPVRHLRTDRWWVPPLVTAVALTAFVVYSTWRAFANGDYYAEPYVSPFYSPCLGSDCVPMPDGARWPVFGPWWGLSPALLVLVFPLGFRLTCYYYRKAYYRGFWASPPAFAIPVSAILSYDVVLAFRDTRGAWGHAGLGTLILLVNSVLIWAYTLSCHSCRHIVGGRLKHFSKHPVRYRLWGWVSALNARHMLLAWSSLVSVAAADFYVYLLATGAFHDPRFF